MDGLRYSLKRLMAVLCFLALAAASSAAQERATISGRITEGKKGDALPGAVITVLGTRQGTVTGKDGSYRLVLKPGTYEIRVSLVGHTSVKRRVTAGAGETATQNFQLNENLIGSDEVVVIGTRGAERTVTNTPVPVDVMTAQELRSSGMTEVSQILQFMAPSFNFPRASVADGTDHVRPSTLRGLGPDQVLVLINGKRRHTSALVNVNGTIGRGSTGVDLNAIPVNAIERVEILRDGAAAQYGSDAIAGVINIILKSDANASFSTMAGTASTEFKGLRVNDGGVLQLDGNYGMTIGEGVLHVSGAFRNRNATNRSLADLRQQYLTGDPRNDSPVFTNLRNHIQGDAKTMDVGGFYNFSYPLEEGPTLYSFGGYTYRNGLAAGFFRRPLDDRTVRSIHANGFLPKIETEIRDASGTAGVKGSFDEWLWDLSGTYGRNSFDFFVRQSNNVSLGAASPTSFYCGTMKFGQLTANLDVSSGFDVGFSSPLNVAFGAEFRLDNYIIEEGEPASYIDGGKPIEGTTRLGPVGAQVFPGFRPSDAVNEKRSNVAVYFDAEAKPVSEVLLGGAARFENYSDFGSTFDAKGAIRYEPVEGFAIRGAASTGFRAPSLSQSFFSSTATNFIGGVPFEIRTFPVNTPAAKALGATDLKPEKSTNLSAGLTAEPVENLSITVDLYQIKIKDRIVFSENFNQAQIQPLIRPFGASGVRFFTNAIDTKTQGIDIILRYAQDFGDVGVTRFTAAANVTKTRVERITDTPTQLKGLEETLFGAIERVRIELGQPQRTFNFALNHAVGDVGILLRTTRFGEVVVRQPAGRVNQQFSAKWITDIDVSYKFGGLFTLGLGVNNAGDIYPDENVATDNNAGIFPYSGISPFGFNGRFVYTRLSAAIN